MKRLRHFYWWFPVAVYAVVIGAWLILSPDTFRPWEIIVLLAGMPLGFLAIWQLTRGAADEDR